MLDVLPSLWASSGSSGGADLLQLVPLLLVFVVMYFFFIRTQQKKDKQHKELLGALKVGDTVVTQAGLIGRIVSFVGEQEILLALAPDVDVRLLKATVARVMDSKEPKQVRNLKKEKVIRKKKSGEGLRKKSS